MECDGTRAAEDPKLNSHLTGRSGNAMDASDVMHIRMSTVVVQA